MPKYKQHSPILASNFEQKGQENTTSYNLLYWTCYHGHKVRVNWHVTSSYKLASVNWHVTSSYKLGSVNWHVASSYKLGVLTGMSHLHTNWEC